MFQKNNCFKCLRKYKRTHAAKSSIHRKIYTLLPAKLMANNFKEAENKSLTRTFGTALAGLPLAFSIPWLFVTSAVCFTCSRGLSGRGLCGCLRSHIYAFRSGETQCLKCMPCMGVKAGNADCEFIVRPMALLKFSVNVENALISTYWYT